MTVVLFEGDTVVFCTKLHFLSTHIRRVHTSCIFIIHLPLILNLPLYLFLWKGCDIHTLECYAINYRMLESGMNLKIKIFPTSSPFSKIWWKLKSESWRSDSFLKRIIIVLIAEVSKKDVICPNMKSHIPQFLSRSPRSHVAQQRRQASLMSRAILHHTSPSATGVGPLHVNRAFTCDIAGAVWATWVGVWRIYSNVPHQKCEYMSILTRWIQWYTFYWGRVNICAHLDECFLEFGRLLDRAERLWPSQIFVCRLRKT